MKKLITTTITITALAMILTVPLAMANQQHHEEKGEKSQEMSMQEDMMGEGGMMNHDGMQKRMQAMRQTMKKIHATQDTAERKRLMQKHMQQMRDAMGEMSGMGERHDGMRQNMKNMDGEHCKKMMKMHSEMMQGMKQQMDARMEMQNSAPPRR